MKLKKGIISLPLLVPGDGGLQRLVYCDRGLWGYDRGLPGSESAPGTIKDDLADISIANILQYSKIGKGETAARRINKAFTPVLIFPALFFQS